MGKKQTKYKAISNILKCTFPSNNYYDENHEMNTASTFNNDSSIQQQHTKMDTKTVYNIYGQILMFQIHCFFP